MSEFRLLRPGVIERRCLLLKDLHDEYIANKVIVDLSNKATNHSVSLHFVQAAVKIGIIKPVKKGRYAWLVGDPSKEMAEQVAKEERRRVRGERGRDTGSDSDSEIHIEDAFGEGLKLYSDAQLISELRKRGYTGGLQVITKIEL